MSPVARQHSSEASQNTFTYFIYKHFMGFHEEVSGLKSTYKEFVNKYVKKALIKYHNIFSLNKNDIAGA